MSLSVTYLKCFSKDTKERFTCIVSYQKLDVDSVHKCKVNIWVFSFTCILKMDQNAESLWIEDDNGFDGAK